MIEKTSFGYIVRGFVRKIDTPFRDTNSDEMESTEMIHIMDHDDEFNDGTQWRDNLTEIAVPSPSLPSSSWPDHPPWKKITMYLTVEDGPFHPDSSVATVYVKLNGISMSGKIVGLPVTDEITLVEDETHQGHLLECWFDDLIGKYVTVVFEVSHD